jgi:hypothetical protein
MTPAYQAFLLLKRTVFKKTHKHTQTVINPNHKIFSFQQPKSGVDFRRFKILERSMSQLSSVGRATDL